MRRRTGPFQPRPTVYHSHYSEPAIHSFGIDLRKFDETNTLPNKVPSILTSLLECITESYKLKEVSDAGSSLLHHISGAELTVFLLQNNARLGCTRLLSPHNITSARRSTTLTSSVAPFSKSTTSPS